MFFPVFAYPRAETQARVIERLEAGMSMTALQRQPGFPSRQTLRRWSQADPGFAHRLRQARAWGQGQRRSALAGPVFDAARAEALLLRIRRGERIGELMRRPEGPNRALLSRWKRERPEFALGLAAAIRFARDLSGPRRPFDQSVADRIIVRVSRGEALPDLAREKAMPGLSLLSRWRRRSPDFDAGLKIATQVGHRSRMREAGKCTPALTAAVARHIQDGGSLLSASKSVPGAPHHLTLYRWGRTRPAFAEAVAWARRMRDEMLLDRAQDIAANTTPESLAADTARLAQLRLRYAQFQGGRKG